LKNGSWKRHGRVFDSLNYMPNIQLDMDAVNKAGGIVEA
jgi:pyruvate carboxylase